MATTRIGGAIARERARRGWTLAQLAEVCRAKGYPVTAQAINEIELGHTEEPTLRMLRALSAAFGWPLARLTDLTPQVA